MLWANRDKLFDVTEDAESYILYWPDVLRTRWPDDLNEQDENHLLQCLWWTMWQISSRRVESEVVDCMLFEIFENQQQYDWSGPAKKLWQQLGSVVVKSKHVEGVKTDDARRMFGLEEPDVTGGLQSIEAMLTWFRDRETHPAVETAAPPGSGPGEDIH